MPSRRRSFLIVGGLLGVVAAGGGFGLREYAVTHVAHYTGDVPRDLSCLACHVDARGGTLKDRILSPRYRTPRSLVLCPDGTRLLVTAQDSNALLVVGAAERRLLAEIPVGRRPHGVAVDRECRVAYVTNEWEDTVSVVRLDQRRVTATLPAGWSPEGTALSGDGRTLFAANWLGNDVSVLDLSSGREPQRIAAGNNPTALALSPDGRRLLVANELSRFVRYPHSPVSEVTEADAFSGRVLARYEFRNAHLLSGIAFAPDGDLALVPLVRPKNLLPALQVERGWMMTNGLGVLDLERGSITQVSLDEPGRFYADPSDVAVTPDGAYAFVSHGGVDRISVIGLPALRRLVREASERDRDRLGNDLTRTAEYVRKRIPTGANPRGMAVSPDSRFLYVAVRLDDRIEVIDVARLERVGTIDLEGPRHESLVRRGEKVFHSARATLQRQFSCRSCHPNGHSDHLQYDFEPDGLGMSIVDNRSLLGIRGTGPFKWNGKNTSLYMQCGIRFARFLTRSAPFPPADLNALVAYINSLEPFPSRSRPADLTPAQARGKALFERARTRNGEPIPAGDRCITCHSGPLYTDALKHDVGTTSPYDKAPWDAGKAFDTPQLNAVALTAPYLHDGKARTLEEIWTVHSPNDTHGVTSDMGKEGLNDLIEYLRTL